MGQWPDVTVAQRMMCQQVITGSINQAAKHRKLLHHQCICPPAKMRFDFLMCAMWKNLPVLDEFSLSAMECQHVMPAVKMLMFGHGSVFGCFDKRLYSEIN